MWRGRERLSEQQGPGREETLAAPGPWPLPRENIGGCTPPVRTLALETLDGTLPPVISDAHPSPHLPERRGAGWRAEKALELGELPTPLSLDRSCPTGEAVIAGPQEFPAGRSGLCNGEVATRQLWGSPPQAHPLLRWPSVPPLPWRGPVSAPLLTSSSPPSWALRRPLHPPCPSPGRSGTG